TLECVGPSARAAAPALRDVLRSDCSQFQYPAALALCKIEGLHGLAMAYLKDAFEQDLTDVIYLDNSLLPVSHEACVFIPCLLRCLRHENQGVFNSAARLLKRIDPAAAAKAGVP